MIKLLIADDEPLVCVGIQSMIKWEEFNIEIVGTARNGSQALEMIDRLEPDIVITDIKMPLKTGLELVEESRELYGDIPVFIILTSFEEFEYVRKAIKFQAVDYLIKLELTSDSLSESIKKALAIFEAHKKPQLQDISMQKNNLPFLQERFFLRLYNGLFENEEQYMIQKEHLGIELSSPAYIAACTIKKFPGETLNHDKIVAISSSTIKMMKEILNKSFICYITFININHFVITFCIDNEDPIEEIGLIEEELKRAISVIYNYFSVRLFIALGNLTQTALGLYGSYYAALRLLHDASDNTPLISREVDIMTENQLIFSETRASIKKAFDELDTVLLNNSLTEIIEYFLTRPEQRIQVMDIACNILYMAISIIPNGEAVVEEIFKDRHENYLSIYKLSTTKEIIEWLTEFRDECCEILSSRQQSYQQQVVSNIQKYILDNLSKKLSLNEVAAVFNFSSGYLSQMFTKYAGIGYVEYITESRVDAAKDMLKSGEWRIYEVAENLGFESAFYFSKVFKKIEGISPREYQQKLTKSGSSSLMPER